MPAVSVIMIFLNPGPFFAEAIASVQAQTFADWELLLVDDGSSDGSSVLARDVATADHRIRYLTHPGNRNRGTGASRALGLQHAEGEYIAMLDSDDVWLPEYLAGQVDVLQRHPEAAAVFSGTRIWRCWTQGTQIAAGDCDRKLGPITNDMVSPGQLPLSWLRNEAETPGTCSILVRREVAQRYGFDSEFRGLFEDQAFLYKLALQEYVYIAPLVLSYYRQHHNSTCHSQGRIERYHPEEPNRAELIFLRWLQQYVLERHPANATILQAIEARLARYGWMTGFRLRCFWRDCRRYASDLKAYVRSQSGL